MKMIKKLILLLDNSAEKLNLTIDGAQPKGIDIGSILRRSFLQERNIDKEIKEWISKGEKIPTKLLIRLLTLELDRYSENIVLGYYPKNIEQFILLEESLSQINFYVWKVFLEDDTSKKKSRNKYLIKHKAYLDKFDTNEKEILEKWEIEDERIAEFLKKIKEIKVRTERYSFGGN